MKKYFLLLAALLIIAGCKKQKSLIIEGTLNNPAQDQVYLSKVDVNVPVIIDSSEVGSKGNFRFRLNDPEPDFYQIGYSPTNYANLLAEPGERIRMNFADSNLYHNYTVTGSKGSELIRMLDLKLIETKGKLDSMRMVYQQASKEPGFETKGPLLEQEYLEIMKEQRRFNIEFILNNLKSLASVKAIYQRLDENTYVLYEPRDLQYLKIVSDTLKKYYPGSKHTKALVSNFEQELNMFNTRKLEQAAVDLPETKLDPDLVDLNGRRIRLSSLRGKYVLLAFWSARSRDCVADNLQLKEFYKTYNRRGFEIYQINLDEDEEAWRTAVRFDELPWINTREDDPADPKNARLYNVRSVPMNYLYDPQGNIIGTNLHGRNLQIKLNQIFSN